MAERKVIIFPRQVLLIEIDRRCAFADCGVRVFIALTKQEASGYFGFECVRCERWNDDRLNERDVPDWWAELNGVSIQQH
jgi:hypothetical protein